MAESPISTSTPARRSVGGTINHILYSIFAFVMNALDLVLDPLQRLIGNKNMPYFFVLPNLLIFGIFVLFPMLLNLYYAMTGGTALFLQDRPFIGLANFKILFSCESIFDPNTCVEDRFWRAVWNTGFFVIFQVAGTVLFSLITALVLNRSIKGRGFFRSVYFYPVLLSPVVVALIWKWILQRDGLINAMLVAFGQEKVLFLLDANWTMYWVIFISVWAQMGFYTLILLAGLQAIPASIYEASSMDGANPWQDLRGITLPLLLPTLFVVLVLSLIRAVQVFDQVYVLTNGGPGTATLFMVQYIYNTGFSGQPQRFGLAAAASVLLGITLLIFTLIQLRVGRSSEAV